MAEEKTTTQTKTKTTTKKEEKPKTSEVKKPAVKKTQTTKKAETTASKKTTTPTKTKTTTKKEEKPKTSEVKKPAVKKQDEKKTTSKKEEKPTDTKTTTQTKEDTKDEEYTVKKKPELNPDIKDKLIKRKQIKKRTPEFLREEWFRYKRIPKNWRRPDGITSKMRINLKYRPSKVRIGFRGPKDVRGLHSSGFQEVMVFNTNDLEKINPKIQAARIGGTVGTKKRVEIEKKADKLDIRILNR